MNNAAPAQAIPAKDEVFFINAGLQDLSTLLSGLPEGADVVLLDESKDGLQQMAEYLEGRQGLTAIHLLSHGAQGTVQAGSTWLNSANLEEHQAALQNIGAALGEEGDLLLYGCDVASGEAGAAFISQLAELTQADVAASTNLTGAKSMGGDWVLEQAQGVEAKALAFEGYSFTLPSYTMTGTTNITLTDGVADFLVIPDNFFVQGGAYRPNDFWMPGAPVITGFNANEDFIDLRNISVFLDAQVDFSSNFVDEQSFDKFIGFDNLYTSFSAGGEGGFYVAGNTIKNGPSTGIVVGYGDGYFQNVYMFFSNTIGTLTAANFLLPVSGVSVTSVTSSTPNGSYMAGAQVNIQVNFSASVTVTGSPELALETGATDRKAVYSSGSSTSTLTFVYTVQAGDSSADLDYLSTSALAGGSIKATAGGADAVLTLPSPGANGSLGTNKNIVIDTTPPTAYATSVALSVDTGTPGDLITNTAAQTISGTLSANLDSNETVYVSIANGAWVAANSTGTEWSLAGATLTGSTSTIRVKVADLAGNDSATLYSANYTLDTSGPTVYFTNAYLETDTGDSATDFITKEGSQTIYATLLGTLDAGDLVYGSLNHGIDWIEITAELSGNTLTWSGLTLSGTSSIMLKVVDNAGNNGTAYVHTYSIDTAPPAAPATPTLDPLSDTGVSSSDKITNDSTPTLRGTAEADSTVTIYDGNTKLGTAVATGGEWSYTTAPLSGASHSFTVTATDTAGNVSNTSQALAITLDTTPPAIASVAVPSDGSYRADTALTFTVNTDDLVYVDTSGGTPRLELNIDGATRYASYVSGSGTNTLVFSYVVQAGENDSDGIAVNALQLNNGNITDSAGNALGTALNNLASTVNVLVDTAAPTITFSGVAFSADTGTSRTDLITNTSAQTISATLSTAPQAGEQVFASLDGGNSWKEVTSYVSGATLTWTEVTLAASNILQFYVRDVAGNKGTITYKGYVLDTTAPTTSNASISFSADTGSSSNDLLTRTAEQTISGTLSSNLISGETVEVSLDKGLSWSSASASADSNAWTLPGQTLVVGPDQEVQVRVTDTAGNHGFVVSTPYVLDQSAPTLEIATDISMLNSAGTASITFTFSEAPQGFNASHIGVSGGVLSPLTATANPLVFTGVFSPLPGQAGIVGGVSVTAGSYTDAAGNAGLGAIMPAISIDTLAPTVYITSNVPVANGVTPAIITFAFSETPVGFSAANIEVSGGALGSLTATVDPRVFTATFTPNSGVAAGSASIAVIGGYTDLAGNDGAPANIQSLLIDTVAPVAAANSGVVFSNDSGAPGDLITNVPTQNISGTLDTPLAAGDVVQVSLDGGQSWNSAATLGLIWTLFGQTLAGGSNGMLVVRVEDAAGNFSAARSVLYTLDTEAPTVTISSNATGTLGPGQSATLTISLSEAAVLTPSQIVVSGGTLSNFSGSGTTYTATVTPAANSSAPLTVSLAANVFTDAAGNPSVAATPLVLSVNTVPTTPQPEPQPTTVDGVSVTITPGAGGSTLVTVPVVTSSRPDTPGSPSSLADIPLVTSSGRSTLFVSLPTGTGIQTDGFATSLLSTDAALAALIARIQSLPGDNSGLIQGAQTFLASVSTGEPLAVQRITPLAGTGFNPNNALTITGSNAPADGKQAIILDASNLPAGSVIQLNNVDFAAIVGSATLRGGDGQNFVIGDDASQNIILGADDDIIHGGGGNDTVGSRGGNDQVYGDAGDDIVFGGAGNDLLSGGSGSDKLNGGTGFDVALQEGKRSDYSITLDGAGIKLTHIASGVADWLVDVEQVRFETGPILTVAHSAAEEAAAFLFQKWMGRDLTQSEGAVIQTLDGLSAVQVADLFAQVFPQQAGGRTAQQLLEGMETAGAIRVDADRSTKYVGDAGDNTFTPTLGVAWNVDGGAGIDTLVFPATLAQTYIDASTTGFTLQRMADGAMLELINVERLTFSDTKLALDLDGHAGTAAKLIGAVAGAAFLDNKPLVGEVIRALDAGVSAQSLAQLGLQLLGAQTPGQVTQLIWTNVVGSAATPAQLQPFVNMMAQGVTGGELAVLASNLDLNATRIDLVGLAATGIEFA